MGVMAGIAAAGVAANVGGMIANSGGGGGYASGSAPPPTYIPQNQPGADQQYQQITNQMVPYATALPGQVIPGLQAYLASVQGNPYAAPALAGAQSAGSYGTGTLAPMQQAGASSLYGMSTGAVPYASQILAQGFDPNNALYNRNVQHLTDQSNAINAMNGVAGTPYGAGLTTQALGNFNIDWQNSQLQREQAAAQGFGSLTNTIGQGLSGASQLGGTALNTLATSSALPYSTYLGQQGDILNALNSLSSGTNNALGPDQNTLNALAAYLKLGQSATSVGQAGAAQNFANNQAIGAGIGSALTSLSQNPALSNLFSSSDPYGYTSNSAYYDELSTLPDYSTGFADSSGMGFGTFGY